MKHLGLVLLVVGIGITAAFGARNPEQVDARTAFTQQVANAAKSIDTAHEVYCTGITEYRLAAQDGCIASEDADERSMAMNMPADVQMSRDAWQASIVAHEEMVAQLAEMTPPPAGARLGAWFKLSGVPFLFGLIFVVAGSLLSRKALKDELDSRSEKSNDNESGPVDFGQKLASLSQDVKALADEMAQRAEGPTEEDFALVQARLETFQLEGFEPLIEARVQVQARHGLAGFAAIFGPLSSAERFINRAWSALVDRHWPEASASVANAAREIDVARGEIDALSDS